MNKFSAALAAMGALLAVSGTALANDVANDLVYSSKKSQAEQALRPEKTNALDFLSTKSIVRQEKMGTQDQPATSGAKSGIDVNPWIVPSFL